MLGLSTTTGMNEGNRLRQALRWLHEVLVFPAATFTAKKDNRLHRLWMLTRQSYVLAKPWRQVDSQKHAD